MDEWYDFYDDSSNAFKAFNDDDERFYIKKCKDFLNWFYEDDD